MTMSKLQTHTRILLAGTILSGIIFGLGQMHLLNQRSSLELLVEECRALGQSSFGDAPVCDPLELYVNRSTDNPVFGIQGNIVSAQESIWNSEYWAAVVPFSILIFSLLPWLWYFLLQRIRELSNAVMGK